MVSTFRRMLGRGVLAAALGVAANAQAAVVVFDFEGESLGDKGASHAITSGGISMTITRLGGDTFQVGGNPNFPSSWGRRALLPMPNTDGGAFLLTFSSAISSISVEASDLAPSDADALSLTVGASVDTDSLPTDFGLPSFATLSLTGLSATQAVLSGGSSAFPQSVYWDNIRIETNSEVPAPGSALLGGAAFAALLLARRRREPGRSW